MNPGVPLDGIFVGRRIAVWGALAACALIAVGAGAYRIGNRTRAQVQSAYVSPVQSKTLASDNKASEELIASQHSVFDLQSRVTTQQQEVTRLRTALRVRDPCRIVVCFKWRAR